MPSKRKSSACVDYVPALCTHRPSLLPIEWLSEASGLAQGGGQLPPRAGKLSKLGHLEEVKVVTRSPLVNQRRDHYRVYNSQTHVNITSMLLRRSRPGARNPLRSRGPEPRRPPEATNSSVFTVSSECAARQYTNESKLSTTDLLVLASMKNAAKCDK